MNKRLIRIQLKDGRGIFSNGNAENLSIEEFEELQELEQDLYSPDIMFDFNSNSNVKFYFTRKGFRKHKALIKLLIKGHCPRTDIEIVKEWANNKVIKFSSYEQQAILQEQ